MYNAQPDLGASDQKSFDFAHNTSISPGVADNTAGINGMLPSRRLANPAQHSTAAAVSPYVREAYIRAFPHTKLAAALSG